MSSVVVDTSTLVELHFLVDELTRNPSNVLFLAKKIKDLLSPYNKVSKLKRKCAQAFCSGIASFVRSIFASSSNFKPL